MNLYMGTKKLQVKLGTKTYKIRNDILEEAMKYAGLIESGSKTLSDVPGNIKALVERLITK